MTAQLFRFFTPAETYPYPYVVQDEFLPPALHKELKRTFPSAERFGAIPDAWEADLGR
jgi:hypothetical protein